LVVEATEEAGDGQMINDGGAKMSERSGDTLEAR